MTSVFDLIVNILTVIAGVLAVVSISIVGVQYLRAGRNEASVKKTKQRMFLLLKGTKNFFYCAQLSPCHLPKKILNVTIPADI